MAKLIILQPIGITATKKYTFNQGWQPALFTLVLGIFTLPRWIRINSHWNYLQVQVITLVSICNFNNYNLLTVFPLLLFFLLNCNYLFGELAPSKKRMTTRLITNYSRSAHSKYKILQTVKSVFTHHLHSVKPPQQSICSL